VIIRFITLNLFLNLGSSRLVNLKMLFHEKVPFDYIKTLLRLNWPFIIIGSISIINWRISTVLISKILERKDVADFEISFRVFSLAQMAPLVVSTTVFPVLINYFKNNNISDFVAFFRKIYVSYFMYGLLAFTFVFSFIDFILPLVFGPNYSGTGVYTKQMFLTILIFPTAFLQANVLIAMKLEKLDMWYNIIILCANLVFCAVGLLFFKSLMIINLSIFFSFIIFHVLQDIVLIRKKISSIWHTVEFYGLTLILTGGYVLLSRIINPVVLFTAFWMVLTGLYLFRNKIMGRTKIRLVLESIRSFARSYPR
jgi:O-antigen/teichoic acid export membrane protein